MAFLKNPIGLQDFMTKNLSFDQQLTSELIFNTTIHKKSLFTLLFHNPNVSSIFHVPNITRAATLQQGHVRPSESISEFTEYIGEGFLYSYMRKNDVSEDIFTALFGLRKGNMDELTTYASSLLKVFTYCREIMLKYFTVFDSMC